MTVTYTTRKRMNTNILFSINFDLIISHLNTIIKKLNSYKSTIYLKICYMFYTYTFNII